MPIFGIESQMIIIRKSHLSISSHIDSAEFYKSSEGILDANALLGLWLLLECFAHNSWTGIKI